MAYIKYVARSPAKFHWDHKEHVGVDPTLFDLFNDHRVISPIKGFERAHADGDFPHDYVDHVELFKANSGGYVCIAHLYDLHIDRNEHNMTQEDVDKDRSRMKEFADKYDLELHFLDDIPSWYNNRCTMVLWKDKASSE